MSLKDGTRAGIRACVRALVRLCRHTLKREYLLVQLANHNPIYILEHHWGGGSSVSGFGSDEIRTLVSMAADSSHRLIMGKILRPL